VPAPRVTYLQSKRSVDDRALCRHVLDALRAELLPGTRDRPVKVLELGAGSGTMIARCVEWDLLRHAEYIGLDTDASALAEARRELPRWANEHGLRPEPTSSGMVLTDADRGITVGLEHADLFEFEAEARAPRDLVIANAVLDLVDIPAALARVWSFLRPQGLFWFTINFDGETIFEPPEDPPFEQQLLELYHRSMDERVVAGRATGGSRTGRRLFTEIAVAGGELVAAGSSDWVVHPVGGRYPHAEAEFLRHILDIIEAELSGHPELDARRLRGWLAKRREQVDRAKLVMVSHQLDFFGRAPGAS
jgi:SAM-dependent methyltransferase